MVNHGADETCQVFPHLSRHSCRGYLYSQISPLLVQDFAVSFRVALAKISKKQIKSGVFEQNRHQENGTLL